MEFRRTGADDFPRYLKMMVAGHPKTGKTTLVATCDGIIVADTEPDANNLASIAHRNTPYVTIRSSQDLRDLHMHLKSDAMRAKVAEGLGIPEVKAVAIDTLDSLQNILKAERLKERRSTQFQRDDWGWLKEEMSTIIRAFTALPMHVIFTVHLKTQNLGVEGERTIVLPGLQGAIAEEIAGMVGFSLYSYRTQEIRPDGTPFTKYWLRTEGDETFTFVGNRASGRLPDVIEPDFNTIYKATFADLPEPASAPAPVAQVAGSTPEPAPAPVPKPAPEAKSDGDDPVNSAALSHVKKVFDAIGRQFPEGKIKGLTMNEARDLVKFWRAAQADEAEGKCDAIAEMETYLDSRGLDASDELDITGNIDSVLTWVGIDSDRAQQAWVAEMEKAKPRQSLLNTLVERGATGNSTPEPPVAAIATVEEPAPEPEAEPQSVEEAVAKELGATVLEVQDEKPCEVCGGPVTDPDIGVLARTRFHKWMCLDDYIAMTQPQTR